MAFGITKRDLDEWKSKAINGEVAFITHFWYDARFPHYRTVTKAGCSNKDTLIQWGMKHGLKAEWIHERELFPHFDLLGERQREILMKENKYDQLLKLERRMKG
ncbi:hypothetical protein QA612_20920 [Evansella sp. AB-P1]|uniref:hypothetical protein n=1 Tax=Evansella sp. AB-P1 TaxID=3037653 RepID=UPI00241F355C|nr:hypothetical protein [Evansella sp. AB-P1]MDG5789923.1 hypothetical protein [Evansella sp. AB-P1]